MTLSRTWSLQDLHAAALAASAPHIVADWIDGGAGDRTAVRRNEQAYARWALRPRALSGVVEPALAVRVLGQELSAPLMFSPSALHGLVHPRGELETAEAARRAGVLMVASSQSSRHVQDIAAVGAPLWFQFYWGRDRDAVRELVQRADHAGCRALCLTVDMPSRPWLHGPMHAALRRVADEPAAHASRAAHVDPGIAWAHDARLAWADLAWLRSITSLPLVIKGIMNAADARLAAEHGAAAVIVSNHGGRALAHSQPTLDVLPEVVDAVGHRIEVYLDGGIRSGSHIAIACAMGARAVLIGRPVQWGLALAGTDGVGRVVEILLGELRSVMCSLGAADIAHLGAGHVAPVAPQLERNAH